MPRAAPRMVSSTRSTGMPALAAGAAREVISKAIVRNVAPLEGGHRTGLAFVDLDKAMRDYIVGLVSAKGLQRTL